METKQLYYFTPWEYGIDNIINKRLKISELEFLNDPSEFIGVQSEDDIIKNLAEHFREVTANNHGVICFSEDWRNPVMWGHYSENHSGLCLGFDINTSHTSVKEVIYQSDKTYMGGDYTKLNLADFNNLGYQKFNSWSYEKESRLLAKKSILEWDSKKDIYFKLFDEHLELNKVIIGLRASKGRNYIHRLLSSLKYESKIEISKVALSKESFLFSKEEILHYNPENLDEYMHNAYK